MKKKWKKLIAAVLALALCFTGVQYNITAEAATDDTVDVEFEVTYCQTEAREILKMVNDFRESDEAYYTGEDGTTVIVEGLEDLKYDYDLETIAMQRAAELVLSYGHNRPNGSDSWTALDEANYVYFSCAENIAMGQTSAEQVFESWKEDGESYGNQGHRRNMLGGYFDEMSAFSFNRIGIACVYYGGTYYWVQEFAYYPSSGESTYVAPSDGTETVSVTVPSDSLSISVGSDSLTLKENEKADLPEVTAKYGSVPVSLVNESVEWKSSNQDVIDISGSEIVAKSAGSATLSVTINGNQYSIAVTVEHDISHVIATDATCTDAGNIEYWYCSECGKYFSDEDCTTEINEEDITIEALGHDWGDIAWSEWAETSDGSYTISASRTCTRCNDVENFTPEITASSTDATCTEEGTVTYSATVIVDGEEKSAELKVVEEVALGHEYDEGVVTKEPTCTEDGEITYTCVRGDDSYTESIDALGHEYGEGQVTTEPTCTDDGEMTYTCSRCGYSYTEPITALGHNWVVEQIVVEESEDKYEEKVGIICSVCGLEYMEEIVVSTESGNGITAHSSLSWDDLITADELAGLFEDGAELDFKLTAEMYEGSNVPVEDKALVENKIENLWAGYDYAVSYLDIDALMNISYEDGREVTQKFEETLNSITITVTIPDELMNADGDSYSVIRVHNGVAEELASIENDGTLTFSSDKFSTYAIVKLSSTAEETDEDEGELDDTENSDNGVITGPASSGNNNNDNGDDAALVEDDKTSDDADYEIATLAGGADTSDPNSIMLWFCLMLISATGIVSVMISSRRKVRR